jgi:hypothetical protein
MRARNRPVTAIKVTGFRAAMAVAHAWLRAGGRWAWGTSVFAVGCKPLAEDRR